MRKRLYQFSDSHAPSSYTFGFIVGSLLLPLLCASAAPGLQGKRGASPAPDVSNFSALAAQARHADASPAHARRSHLRVRSSKSLPTIPASRQTTASATDSAAPDTADVGEIAAAADLTVAGGTGVLSPPTSADFEALPDNGTAFTPDTSGAVGPDHLVTTLSSEIRVQDRSGTAITTLSLNAFWGSVGDSRVFDPRVLYDHLSQRWITTAMSNPGTNNSSILIAVSETSDPTGTWFRHAVQVDSSSEVYASAPNVGLNSKWITVQANLIEETNFLFSSSGIWVFDKATLYAGGAASFTHFDYLVFGLSEANALVPAVTYDASQTNQFLVANWTGNFEGLGFLRVYSITGDVGSEVFNDFGPDGLFVDNDPFGNPPWESFPATGDDFAPQLGTSEKIFIGDARIQNVVHRNGRLWCAQHVFLPIDTPTRCSIQWWEFTTGATLLQGGRLDDATGEMFYAYPSIAVNADEDLVVGYTSFSANQYPTAEYSFHRFEDGPGTLRDRATLKDGESSFYVPDPFDVNGWGDWSSTVVDPLNDTDMWTIQQYAAAPVDDEDRWGTWWGRISPPTSLTLGVSEAPNPVLAGSNLTYSITVDNNFDQIATGVRVTQTIPTGGILISAVPSSGSCDLNGTLLTCDFGDVTNEATATASIVLQLNQSGVASSTFTAFANGPDEDETDNSVTIHPVVLAAADLAVNATVTPDVVTVGKDSTYLVTITNRGPSVAPSITLTNLLPSGLSLVSAITEQGSCSHDSGLVTCNVGGLSSGESILVTIIATSTASGLTTNEFTVATTGLDPNLSNNSASAVNRANAPPTLQPISNRVINEDTVLGPVPFTIGDVETPVAELVLTASSSNQQLVPDGNVVLGGSGTSRTITVTPLPDAAGSTTITRILEDEEGTTTTNSFSLTVLPLNDLPTISDIQSQEIDEDTSLDPIPFTVDDVETPAGNLLVTAASSNPSLIPNSSIQLGGSGSNRTIALTPAANQFGSATITVTVNDGGATTNDTFVVTVNAVNDLPTISGLIDTSVDEDVATPPLAITVDDVETPAAVLVVTASSSNQSLVPDGNIVPGGSGSTRTIRVTPAPDQFGSATITVSVTDASDDSSESSFVLTVNSVNDAPTLDALFDLSVDEDSGEQTVSLVNITSGAANETQTLTVTADSSETSIVPHPTVTYTSPNSTGTLRFTPEPNANGVAEIFVTVTDTGSSNNTVEQFFAIDVVAVNDAPTISAVPDQQTDEDVPTDPIPFDIDDIDSPIGSLTVFGRSSNAGLLPDASVVIGGSGTSRTLTLTPEPDQSGTTTVTVFVTDGSETNSTTFELTVQSVNDLPTISAVVDQQIDEDGATSVDVTIGDVESAASALTVNAFSSDENLLASFAISGSDSSRTIGLTPEPDQFGSTTVTVEVVDPDNGTNSTSFLLTVAAVNDLPTLDPLADLGIDEDAGEQSVALSGISSGAANEIQTLVVGASSDNISLIPTPSVTYTSPNSAGNVLFTPVAEASGIATINVSVFDGTDTVNQSFEVTVSPVNDPPTISSIGSQSTDEDTTIEIPFTLSDVDSDVNDVTVRATSSNEELLDASGISFGGSGADRTIILTPLQDQSATSTTITLFATDASNAVASIEFQLDVIPVNDPPSITGPADVVMDEDTTEGPVQFIVFDPESLPSALIVSATSSDETLIPSGNIVHSGNFTVRFVTLTPVADQFGTATIELVVKDGPEVDASSATNTFLLTVNNVNDPPTLDAITDLNLSQGAGAQTVDLAGISSGTPNENETLSITAVSSNTGLIPNPSVNYTSPDTTGSLGFTPVGGVNGSATITVTVDDGQSTDNTIVQTFDVVVSGPISFFTTFLEAESGQVTAPMLVGSDTNASGGEYVSSAVDQSGTVSLQFSVPQTDDYWVWCRVITTGDLTDSFFVSVDGGGEDIYDAAEDASGQNNFSPDWQWTRVNGRSIGNPRVFSLDSGNHTLLFAGREADTSLDALYVTNDPDFDPYAVVTNEPPVITIALVSGNAVVSWPTDASSAWVLQSNTQIGNAVSWVNVAITPTIVDDRYSVTMPASGLASFYRLFDSSSQPALTVLPAGGNDVVVSWDVASGSDWVLQSSSAVSSPVVWTQVSPAPVIVGDRYTVTTTRSGAAEFFRLEKP